MKANAAEEIKTVSYYVSSKDSVTASGDVINGTEVNYVSTYNTTYQITKNNSMTFNLSGIPENYIITNITLNTKTNKSSGAGNVEISVGDATIYNGKYSMPNSDQYSEYSFDVSNLTGDINVILKCTTNSLYCNRFDISYYIDVETANVNFYDGNLLIGSQEVILNDVIDFSLVDTHKDDYAFEGWYEDPEFTIAYDEDAPVTGDLNLYAHYIAHEDLTSGEIFASETTKTSLVASVHDEQKTIEKTILYSDVLTDFSFDGKSKLSELGFDEKWSYESKDNGSDLYPTIYASDDTLRFYKNGTFVKFNYDGIIHSITFSKTTGLNNFTISGDDGIEVKGDNGKYTFENGTSSIKILNNANDTIRLYGSFSIEYEDMITVPTNASIRFGATLDAKLYDTTAKYGVVFGLEGQDLNTLAEGKTTIEELELPYREVDHNTIAKVDEIGALEESETPETAQYFQYAIVVKNMLAHIDEEITAACYMQTTDGLYVMNEVTYSLRSLAQKYIDDHVADESIDVLNAIVNYQA